MAAACIAAFFVFGAVAVVGLAGKARQVLTPAVGSAHAAVVRYAILLVGGATILVLGIGLMKVPIGQLLVGGAVTTILLGIAGQQSLSNIFAGLVLLLSRPFTVGDYIRLKSGALGGVTDGLVTEIGITYLRLDTEDGTLHLPNSQVLAAAVGPIARPQPEESGPLPREPPPARPARPARPNRPMTTRRTAGRRTDRHDARARCWSIQWCFASYLATTSAGIRPRSLTSIPVCLAQLRMAALCCR